MARQAPARLFSRGRTATASRRACRRSRGAPRRRIEPAPVRATWHRQRSIGSTRLATPVAGIASLATAATQKHIASFIASR